MQFRFSGGGSGKIRRTVCAKGALLIATMLGCQAARPGDPISQTSLPIVGGSNAATCEWPSTVMLIGPLVCSGTLVHPRAVVTAKHCVMDKKQTRVVAPSAVGFGESREQWARIVLVSACHVHPTNDVGLCILAEDVTDVPIVPVMAPCETSELLPGRPVIEVGFGVIGATSPIFGSKKWISATIESRSADLAKILVSTVSQDGEYFGDSGGPLFFRMPDQTWRLIGEDCCSDDIDADAGPRVSTYFSLPYHVAWLEEQSGLDLTPCHDLVGWNPDVSCTEFPTDPGTGVGTWDTSCGGGPTARVQPCTASPSDAGPSDDAGAAEVQDAAWWDSHPDDRAPDAQPDAPSWDARATAADSLASPADGPLDGWDTARAVEGNDTATPDPDASAHEVNSAPADGASVEDGGAVPDAAATDAWPWTSDGSNDGAKLIWQSTGCACRSAGARPTGGWPLLVSFGLVGAAGRALRRRRPPDER